MWGPSRILCTVAGILFLFAALGGGFGVAVVNRELATAWGFVFFAAGHVF